MFRHVGRGLALTTVALVLGCSLLYDTTPLTNGGSAEAGASSAGAGSSTGGVANTGGASGTGASAGSAGAGSASGSSSSGGPNAAGAGGMEPEPIGGAGGDGECSGTFYLDDDG